MVGTIKLTYVKNQKRYTKMVKGSRWYSTSPLSNSDSDFAKALTEFTFWKEQKSSPDKLHGKIIRALQLMRDNGHPEYLELADELEQRAIDGDEPKSVELSPWKHSPESNAMFNQQANQGRLRRTGGIKTYGEALKEFEAYKQTKVGKAKWDVLKSQFNFLRPQLENIELEKITLQQWETIFDSIKNNPNWKPSTADGVLILVRAFFRWLSETTRTGATPAFVNSKIYSIKKTHKQPVYFSVEEMKQIMKAATPLQKLYFELMLNCGMTAKDLSDLEPSQIDFKNGTLTRRREKHDKIISDEIPTVRYTLWKSVLDGLKKHGLKSGENVFLAEDGKPLCGASRRDKVAQGWQDIQKATGIEKTVKIFRKSGASAIGSNSIYKVWREIYLANKPQKVTDKNYDGTTELPVEITNHIKSFFKI